MLTLHILSLLFAGCIILLADREAFAWLSGKKKTLNPKRMHGYHLLMWEALIFLVVTGIIMALPRLEYLLHEPLFVIKMLFVGILFVNAVIIGKAMAVAEVRSYASLTKEEKTPLLLSGVISAFSWVSTVIVALALFS